MQLIDSNILVYYWDIRAGKKHLLAKELLDPVWKKETEYALSVQNLSEFFSVITTKNKLSKEKAAQIIRDITEFPYWRIFQITEASIRLAVGIATKTNAPFWDVLIAATMKEHGIREIVTENEKDFANIPGIKVINPFK